MSSEEPLNVSIDSTNWTEIAMDGDTAAAVLTFRSRDGATWKWKKTATSDNYFTFLDGESGRIGYNRERQPTTLFFAQTVSGTAIIEVFIFNHN